MKKIIFGILFLCSIQILAQEDKNIIIKVIGTGKTIEEANNNALRSALEQSFRNYISTRTEIFNDKIISEEITSIPNGNIEKFSVLTETQIPTIGFSVIIEAVISTSKLTTFAKSKGFIVELNGGGYAANIKQQKLNEMSEINSISSVFGLVHELLQNSFDYKIIVNEPQSISSDSNKWNLPIVVESFFNENINSVNKLLIDCLSNISLSKTEIENYKSLGKKTHLVRFKLSNNIYEFYLRRLESVKILNNIKSNWFFYNTNFIIENNQEELSLINRFNYFYEGNKYIKYKLEIKNKDKSDENISLDTQPYKDLESKNKPINVDFYDGFTYDFKPFSLNLFTSGTKGITFNINHPMSLEDLEKTTEYKITSRGVLFGYKYGGYIINNGLQDIIVSPINIENNETSNNWNKANQLIKDYNVSGFNNWEIPSINNNQFIINNLFLKGISGCDIKYDAYLCKEEKDTENAFYIPLGFKTDFDEENKIFKINESTPYINKNSDTRDYNLQVRPIRFINNNNVFFDFIELLNEKWKLFNIKDYITFDNLAINKIITKCDDDRCVSYFMNKKFLYISFKTEEVIEFDSVIFDLQTKKIIVNKNKFYINEFNSNNNNLIIFNEGYDQKGRFFQNGTLNLNDNSIIFYKKEY